MGTSANIVIPRPELYVAPVATALPTVTGTLGGSITWTGFTSVGFLGQGSKVTMEFMAERRKIQPMNKVCAIDAKTVRKGLKITLSLHESDVAAWNLALSSATEDTDVLSDSDADDPVFKQLAIQTPTKVWQIRKVTSDENAKTELDDSTEEMVQIVLEAYEYEAATAGQRIWKCHTRTAP